MSSTNKQGKMVGYIMYRMRVVLLDGRTMTGQMLAFDKHMNLVLADTEEFRKIKRRQKKPESTAPGAAASAPSVMVEDEEKRTLGLAIVRGAQIVSLSVESAPPADPSARLGKATGATTLRTSPPAQASRGPPAGAPQLPSRSPGRPLAWAAWGRRRLRDSRAVLLRASQDGVVVRPAFLKDLRSAGFPEPQGLLVLPGSLRKAVSLGAPPVARLASTLLADERHASDPAQTVLCY